MNTLSTARTLVSTTVALGLAALAFVPSMALGGSNAVTVPRTVIADMQADSDVCREGLELLHDNMYVYPEDPTVPSNGKRAWSDVYGEFKADFLPACDAVGDVLDTYKEGRVVRWVMAYQTGAPETSWEDLFYGNIGIVPMGDRIEPYCPALHLSQFDCVSVTVRIDQIDIPGATLIMDKLDQL